jgi:hypothetical protein
MSESPQETADHDARDVSLAVELAAIDLEYATGVDRAKWREAIGATLAGFRERGWL